MTLEVLKPHQELISALPNGYESRSGTLEDVPAVVTMLNQWSQAYFHKDQFSEADIHSEWTTPEFDPSQSTRVIVAPDGSLAAVIEVWNMDNPPVKAWTWARVHPKHEGLGLGTYLLEWGEQRARQDILRCPAEAKVVQHVAAHQGHEPSKQLFLDSGFLYNRSFYTMQIKLTEAPPEPVLPEGIVIRAANLPEELAEVVHTDRDGFKDHWGHIDTPFEEELAHWQHMIDTDPEHDNSLWFVAVDQQTGRFAGVNLCRSKGWNEPDMAWVSSLAVRREYRQRGVGLALLQHSFGEFWRRGLPTIGLGVDASNLTGALRLYERAGMSIYLQRDIYEKVLRDGVDMMTTQLES